MSNVKGVAIIGLVKYIKKFSKQRGQNLEEILTMLSPEDRDIFSKRILSTEWYPYSIYVNLGNLVDKIFGKGDFSLAREIGKLSAETDLGSVYKTFVHFQSPAIIIKRAMNIWGSYYDTGDVEVKEIFPGKAAMHIREFPNIGKFHCKNIEGWIEKFIELSGYKEAKVAETKCQTQGDDCCEFIMTWKA